eukprot:5763245-Pyramimonas_sp.AAC.1
MGWSLGIVDAKNAPCQSNKHVRPRGAISAEACSGLGLPGETLIELVAPVYGLSDAPLLWHRTPAEFLSEIGFKRFLLEPCLWLQRSDSGRFQSLVHIEVDDLIVSGDAKAPPRLKEHLLRRFTFG